MISGTADQLEVRRPGHASLPAIGDPADASSARSGSAVCAAAYMGDAPDCDGKLQRDAIGSARSAEPDIGAHVGARGASPAVARGPIESGSKLDTAILRIQACTALTGLGWKRAIARAAVDAALAAQGPETTLERLIFESLRRCPAPRA